MSPDQIVLLCISSQCNVNLIYKLHSKKNKKYFASLCLRFVRETTAFASFFYPARFIRSSVLLELNPHFLSVSPVLCVNGFDRAELSQNLRCHFQSRGSRWSSDGRCGRPDSVKMFPLWRTIIM